MVKQWFVFIFTPLMLSAYAQEKRGSFLNYVHAYHYNKDELKKLCSPAFLDFIETFTKDRSSEITLRDICKLHHLIYRGAHADQAGKLRVTGVRVNGMKPPHASHVKALMQQLVSWLNTTKEHPLQASSDFHLKLVDIHPFKDGNGRTARTLYALLLLKNGYPAPSFVQNERRSYSTGINRALRRKGKNLYSKVMFGAVRRSLVNIKGKY